MLLLKLMWKSTAMLVHIDKRISTYVLNWGLVKLGLLYIIYHSIQNASIKEYRKHLFLARYQITG